MLSLHKFFLVVGVSISLLFNTGESGDINIKDIEISHSFNEFMTVQAMIYPTDLIESVNVHIQYKDSVIDNKYPMNLNPSGKTFSSINLNKTPFIPFSTLKIWFEVEKKDGTIFNNDPIYYFYNDNRFNWKTLKTNEFEIAWYQDTPALGEKVLQTAQEGISKIQKTVTVPVPVGIQIYVYSNAAEMREALMFSPSLTSWIVGHSKPELKVVLVSIPPGIEQAKEINRQIPHELTHILLFEKIGEGYNDLPRWLNEGLASKAEINPNPDYQAILKHAHDHDALIPLEDLCIHFPSNSNNIQLSYAEANSFVSYLQTEYGMEIIEELVQSFENNRSCEQGIQSVFNRSLSELETDWQRTLFNGQSLHSRVEESIPLIIIIAILFIGPIFLGTIRLIKIKSRRSRS